MKVISHLTKRLRKMFGAENIPHFFLLHLARGVDLKDDINIPASQKFIVHMKLGSAMIKISVSLVATRN